MKKSFFNLSLVVLLSASFFLPLIIKGKLPIPADSILNLYHPFRDIELDGFNKGKFPAKNPFINDPVLQTYEWRNLVVKNIKGAHLPLWNPYNFSGQPLLANFQSATFQILNIFFFFLPFKLGWATNVIIPPILLATFMYLFLKALKLSDEAAIFGSTILPFSGFFMPWLTWGTIVTTAMWLPLILLSILKLQSKLSATWFLMLALSSTFTIFSGHAQTALYVFLASIIFIITSEKTQAFKPGMIAESSEEKNTPGFSPGKFIFQTKSKIFTLAAILLGLLISAIQIVPFMEFINLSARGLDQGYSSGREDWFLPIQNLIQLVAPDFFGNPATNNYWGIWNWWEFVTFIGIVPLAFAIYSVIKKAPGKSPFITIAGLSLLFALANPISKLPYTTNFPLISSMQPSRIIFLLVFSLVTLSAIGLDFYLKEKKEKFIFIPVAILAFLGLLLIYTHSLDSNYSTIAQRNLILPIITAIALFLISLVKILKVNTKAIYILIFLVTLFELFRFAYKFTPFSKPSWIFPQTKIIEYLENQQKPFRIMTTDRRLMHPNISSAYSIESTDGYDPLYLESYARLVSVWQSNNAASKTSSFNRIITPQNINSPIINLLNVKYILSLNDIDNSNFEKIMEEGETKLYQNNSVKPRAFFASEVRKVNNDGDELEIILDKKSDPTLATSQSFSFEKQGINNSINIESYNDQSITLKTSTDKPAPLILTNPIYPGWYAYIDGQKTETRKADYMFMSTMVPQGNHTVEFKFESKSFYNGLILSLVGIGLTIASVAFIWKKKLQ